MQSSFEPKVKEMVYANLERPANLALHWSENEEAKAMYTKNAEKLKELMKN